MMPFPPLLHTHTHTLPSPHTPSLPAAGADAASFSCVSHCIRVPKATNQKGGGGSRWPHDVLSPGNELQIAAVVAEKSKKKAAWKEKKAVTGGNWARFHTDSNARFQIQYLSPCAAAAALFQPLVSLRSPRDQIYPVYKLRREIQGHCGRRYRSYHTRDCTAVRTTYYSGRQPLTDCPLCFVPTQRFLGFSGRK